MSPQPPLETDNSFAALLALPPNQAVKLLHSPEEPTTNVFSSLNNCNLVKQESIESGFVHNWSPIVADPIISKSTKRKNQEKKVKSPAKKIKSPATETDGSMLPYVHVRARRGEATDSHSLAERARREKINARMKLLQQLVPGCNKISGTAMVLDEIINHVQALQLQIENLVQLLSMKRAAIHPIIDINIDTLFSSESGSALDCNMISPSWWCDYDGQVKWPH